MKNIGNVFILGDSYSTFKGHIPEGFDYWYSEAESPDTDVRKVEETWWHQLLSETKSKLVRNCSYSGTTVCNTGYGGADCREISFIGRFEKLVSKGFFKENQIDTFFIFGGTNDSWAESPIGELMYEAESEEDTYKVLPAFCRLLSRVKAEVSGARIMCVINCDLKEKITEGFKTSCGHFGAECVELKDISKCAGHPDVRGMIEIKDQIFEKI